jgi:protein ImuB
MLWAALYFPHFAIDAELRTQADPSAPLALITGPANKRVLLDVNDAARLAGLSAGQSLNTAWTLLADFTALPHNPQADLQLQNLLLNWAYQFSAMVFGDALDSIVLEVQSSLALFGPWPVFANRLASELSELNVRVQIALAPSACAALALAKSSRFNKPSKQTISIMQLQELDAALKPIALQYTSLTAAHQQMLAAMGIHTLGRLFALPRDGLTRRLGIKTLTYLDQLRGQAPEVHDYYLPPAQFAQRVEFHFELNQVQALLFPLRRMLSDLSVFLRSRGLGVQQFALKLEHDASALDTTTLQLGLLSAENDPTKLFDLSKLKLESLQLHAPVRTLGIYADQLAVFDPHSVDLFDARTAKQSFEALREKLRIKLGHESIYQLLVSADPRPEHSQIQTPQRHTSSDEITNRERPSWLLMRAIPLHDFRVDILAGPERIESGWWDGGDIRRDYYVVRTSLGQIAWAFRPAGDQSSQWMLQGWFA